ncbi:MAG: tRNA 2-thiouridine(34) synthase MnmA [Candidatus Omnitrophica bacterium CG07_land_8_20_14_0_80_42_15]|uniref:tRNA-specific 2-thiouridylase MnmA n=1 Tax=Candidatus Aquitaenariimonas noxiae TaxID=1974741 RepID=A0A2J0KYN8_9BACT|nr:MAG: tRNA 2-thiouridine(34) synthase MnmA [Candidatus Omnitrophica bacterium CG07_land_8_20_14_0_80_42_15]
MQEIIKNKKTRIVIAMSGGVDSSAAAALLKKEGYEVIGMTMKTWPKSSCGSHRDKACCSLEGITDARVVAETLGIPYYVLDFAKEFRTQVIDYFCNQYLNGLTPNPCIVCNAKMKFGHLLDSAKKIGANLIATGHYANVEYDKKRKRYLLKKGKDKTKDQSYFLFNLTQEQLSHIVFPLGHLTKAKVRAVAKKMGLKNVYRKMSSQEICFMPDKNFPKFLKDEIGVKPQEGDIVDTKGNVLGRHKGIPFYTVGQRHGLGIAHKVPLYVVAINKDRNQVIVGEKNEVKSKSFIVENINMISKEKLEKTTRLKVKIRYMHKAASASVRDFGNGEILVEFDNPAEAITPGQAAVFYKGDTVVGGGWIKRSV